MKKLFSMLGYSYSYSYSYSYWFIDFCWRSFYSGYLFYLIECVSYLKILLCYPVEITLKLEKRVSIWGNKTTTTETIEVVVVVVVVKYRLILFIYPSSRVLIDSLFLSQRINIYGVFSLALLLSIYQWWTEAESIHCMLISVYSFANPYISSRVLFTNCHSSCCCSWFPQGKSSISG